jgi:hypothetical protein
VKWILSDQPKWIVRRTWLWDDGSPPYLRRIIAASKQKQQTNEEPKKFRSGRLPTRPSQAAESALNS